METKLDETRRIIQLTAISDVRDDAIACYGLLEAIHSQYVNEGVLSSGALLYCQQSVEGIARKINYMEKAEKPEYVPF